MSAPYAPPPGGPPLDALPPDAPATVEDVRAARRWTWVAFAWAIAASVIAALALVKANDNSSASSNQPAQTTTDQSAQIRTFEKQAGDRLDAFSRRLNGSAAQSDVEKLDKRLTKVEDDASKAQSAETDQATALKQLQTDAADLQKRVDKLEAQQGQGTTTTP